MIKAAFHEELLLLCLYLSLRCEKEAAAKLLNITTFKYLRRRLKINIKIFLALFKEVKNEF